MIDPDGINLDQVDRSNIISLGNVPPFEGFECYCLDDEKEYKQFIKDIERNVRRSFEYREYMNYIRDNMQMNKCAFLKDVSNEETFDIRIEIHHYPFSLFDICEIVVRKRLYYKESMTLQMVSKEVMKLHYQLLVGLIPLSETVHELAHNSKLFIPSDKVFGNYNTFVDMYQPFCDPDQLDTLERIDKYSNENRSDLLNTTIINQNIVSYDIKDPHYMLPDTSNINTNMLDQIQKIKDNNYILPSVNDKIMLEDKSIKTIRKPITFDESLKNDHWFI